MVEWTAFNVLQLIVFVGTPLFLLAAIFSIMRRFKAVQSQLDRRAKPESKVES